MNVHWSFFPWRDHETGLNDTREFPMESQKILQPQRGIV